MRISLPLKLMASYLLVAAIIIGPSVWYLRGALVKSLEKSQAFELEGRVEELRDRLSSVPDSQLDATVRDYARLSRMRLTVVRADGVVLADSDVLSWAIAALPNHGDRPEVKTALAGGFGYSARTSSTVGHDLLYAALPLAGAIPPRGVVRVAVEVTPLRETVGEALTAQRLAAGLGLSAAIGLSFIAALFVSSPLRRMRDAARAFSQSRWVSVERVRTGDELEDLSVALDELGRKLGAQLVEVGAQEALLAQAVRSFPLPALVLSPTLAPLHVNGAFRRWAGIAAANEAERLAALTSTQRLRIAVAEAERTGLPTDMSLVVPAIFAASEEEVRAQLVPLGRPSARPLWLLVVEPGVAIFEAHGPQAVHRILRGAEVVLDELRARHPELRLPLAQLRFRLDEAAEAAGPSGPVSVEPTCASTLVERCLDDVRALHPDRADHVVSDVEETTCRIAESAGLAARAVRALVGESMRALPPGRTLTVSLLVEASQVKVSVEGAAPPDLEPLRRMARVLGTDAARVPSREREAAWLGLPRA